MERYSPGRKIIVTEAVQLKRQADYQPEPDRPRIITRVLRDSSILMSRNPTIDGTHFVNLGITTRPSLWEETFRREIYNEVAPLTPKPITPPRRIAVAGGRTIGGGTSNESLRRARKKAARRS